MKLSALAVVLIALGIALGLAFRATVFEAEAAKPVKPPPTGRLIELGTITSTPGAQTKFPLANTSDCSLVTAVATTSPVGPIDISLSRLSLDGTTLVPLGVANQVNSGGMSSASLAPAPFIQLGVSSGLNPVNITAWLWCAP